MLPGLFYSSYSIIPALFLTVLYSVTVLIDPLPHVTVTTAGCVGLPSCRFVLPAPAVWIFLLLPPFARLPATTTCRCRSCLPRRWITVRRVCYLHVHTFLPYPFWVTRLPCFHTTACRLPFCHHPLFLVTTVVPFTVTCRTTAVTACRYVLPLHPFRLLPLPLLPFVLPPVYRRLPFTVRSAFSVVPFHVSSFPLLPFCRYCRYLPALPLPILPACRSLR